MKIARKILRTIDCILIAIALSTFSIVPVSGSDHDKGYDNDFSAGRPIECMRTVDINQLVFGISNFGRIGTGYEPLMDCITGARVPQMEYPSGSFTTYLYKGALWVGARVGNDTLVSTGADYNSPSWEFVSDLPIIRRSILSDEPIEAQGAVSELDYIADYTDTTIRGQRFFPYGHRSMQIAITQRSLSWSYSYAEDITLIDFAIENVGNDDLNEMYVGLYMDADVNQGNGKRDPSEWIPDLGPGQKSPTLGRGDICGFLYDVPTRHGLCDFRDTVGVAWTIDADGDNDRDRGYDVPNVTGIRLLGDLFDMDYVSYNWWVAGSLHPQTKDKYREDISFGHPRGDPNKYYVMSNGEVDYDSPFAATIDELNPVWAMTASPGIAKLVSTGIDVQHVLSVGPFDLAPGATIFVPYAIVGGRDIHVDWRNFGINLGNNYRPDVYMSKLDFSDLAQNAMTASRIFDNPGVDTDGDGYFGKVHECFLDSALVDSVWEYTVIESTWYEGDGVPDYKSAGPPPPPDFWISSAVNGVHIRFNGFKSETTRDVFSGLIDFEGYRVYMARDLREDSFSMMASYDFENFDKYVFHTEKVPPRWEIQGIPFSLDELRCLYSLAEIPCDDLDFDPLQYTPGNPMRLIDYPDSVFYFTKHDYNVSRLQIDTPIRKIYPTVPKPDLTKEIPPDQYTEDGYLKFYEYEVTIDNLVPTVPYYASVTTFDFGSPESGLEPLETSRQLNATQVFAAASEAELTGAEQDAYVYPNPFRVNADYRAHGLEGRGRDDLPEYRTYRINFANIPNRCWIRIFSLDGDLIKEFRHDEPFDSPTARHAEWDLVTRNRQLIVSGLYYWTIEADDGRTQIGKLVVLF